MDSLVLYISASLAVLALTFSVISLVLHWIRRTEHPAVAPVTAELHTLRGEVGDLWDKFTYWQRRQRQRQLREGKERAEEGDDSPTVPNLTAVTDKKELRRQWLNGRQAG